MNKLKLFKVLSFFLVMLMALSACASEESEYTTDLKNDIFAKYGLPNVDTYFEYSQLKEIYELRDDPNLICYWYTKNDMSGKWIYQGHCIGYGIPYAASITADEAWQEISGWNWGTAPQAEPNGLYTNGLSTSATWILSADESGSISPIYVESEITVTQNKLPTNLCEEWSITPDY